MSRHKSKSFRNVFALTMSVSIALAPTIFPAIFPRTVQAAPNVVHSLPLGQPNLKETREKKEIAKGVTYTKIVRGFQSEKEVYIVDIAFSGTLQDAEAISNRLKTDGYNPKVETITKRAPDDLTSGPLGYLVRLGSFKTENEANKLKDELSGKGYKNVRVVYSGEDGVETTGPWVVNVVEINPKIFKGKIMPELGTEIVPGREKVSSVAARTKALAATNGGYFVMGPTDGTEGDLAGVSMIGGKLISEAVNGRTSVILSKSGKNVRIAPIETHLSSASSDGAKREIDGLNRKPGLIRACGGIGDTPTDRPKHDFTCTDSGELIEFTSKFGHTTDPGTGVEAVLDSTGKVIELRNQRGGAIPKEGMVLSGTTDGADWLLAHAKVGAKINLKTSILANSSPVPIDKTTGMINGGPRLLQGGKVRITAFAEGFHWTDSPEFYYRFGDRRNPRTLLGVKGNGNILLVTVDGHHPDYSVGASFEESAKIMKSLGAADAVNLDGGGSTTMTLESQLVTHPTDATGERPVGDAILVMP
jgi:hypothetical protein